MLITASGSPAEVVFEVEAGPRKGERITGRIWKPPLIERAGKLAFDDQVVVYLEPTKPGQRYGYRRIIDFHAAREPTVGLKMAADNEPAPANGFGRPTCGRGLSPHRAAKILKAFAYGIDDETDDAEDADDVELFTRVLEALCALQGSAADDCDEEDFELEDYSPTFHVQFHARGSKKGYRSPEKWEPLLAAYGRADPSRGLQAESHLSVYQYTADAISYQTSHHGSVAGYCGVVWSRWLTIDLDGDGGLEDVLDTARIIASTLCRLGVPRESLLIFFSGRRGIHIQFPSTVAGAEPQVGFERVAGHFCQLIADLAVLARGHAQPGAAQVGTGFKPAVLDWGMYRPNAMLRAPNTKHPQTNLFKIRLSFDELVEKSADAIRELAASPRPFEMPAWQHPVTSLLSECWTLARTAAEQDADRLASVPHGEPRIFNDTLDFIHHGAPTGSRSRRLFRAALNLLQFRCPASLVLALLEPPAAMSGLTTEEIREQIFGACRHHERRPLSDFDCEEDAAVDLE